MEGEANNIYFEHQGGIFVPLPASPTNTSCGELVGPSPTALYTLSRIS